MDEAEDTTLNNIKAIHSLSCPACLVPPSFLTPPAEDQTMTEKFANVAQDLLEGIDMDTFFSDEEEFGPAPAPPAEDQTMTEKFANVAQDLLEDIDMDTFFSDEEEFGPAPAPPAEVQTMTEKSAKVKIYNGFSEPDDEEEFGPAPAPPAEVQTMTEKSANVAQDLLEGIDMDAFFSDEDEFGPAPAPQTMTENVAKVKIYNGFSEPEYVGI
ncbi:uncharacterized protein EV154DRAFT_558621 [Mucor mucedo]|uniref:uncharacterized protein n=1 Tax=Mucor mucedo TaxID=29922 RepID=UPI0022203943|nr:uncharacterized protein EV154DRAFT_558621 [Mucor mucedo]KAI7896281.1 hypothetical protein EV154DRAFT_558621 [Mucor mucedo]